MIVKENPARIAEVVGTVAVTGAAGVDAAVRRAEAARRDWAAGTVAERVAGLRRGAAAIAGRTEELAVLLARESGKPLADCRGEIGFALAYLEWVCGQAPEVLAAREIDDGAGRLVTRRRPYGVVACVTP